MSRWCLAVETDINLLGAYLPQWLIATKEHVLVFDVAHGRTPVVHIAFSETKEFQAIAGVGSGIVQAQLEGVWIDLLRYSNGQKYWFSRLVKRLKQLRAGEEVELEEEDDHDPLRCRSCGLMLSFNGETCPRCIHRGAVMSRLFGLMRPYAGSGAFMMVLLVAGVSLDMVGPQMTRFLVDHVLKLDDPNRGQLPGFLQHIQSPTTLLLLIVGIIAIVAICRQTVNATNGRVASRVGTLITFDIRNRLVEHMEKLDISYYDRQPTGSLVGRVAYDTNAIQDFMGQLTGGFFVQILLVVLSGTMMCSISPQLALWTLLPAPFVLAGTVAFYRFVYPKYHRLWDRSNRQAGLLSGVLSGIRVVKAFAQEERELDRFKKAASELRDARLRVDFSASTFYPIMGLVFSSGGWLIWYIGGQRVLGRLIVAGRADGLLRLPRHVLWPPEFTDSADQLADQLHHAGAPDFRGPGYAGFDQRHAVSGCHPEDARRDRVLECGLWLHAPDPGDQGRELQDRGRPEDRHRRPQRLGQDDRHQPAVPLL